jgi:hypothetical protein
VNGYQVDRDREPAVGRTSGRIVTMRLETAGGRGVVAGHDVPLDARGAELECLLNLRDQAPVYAGLGRTGRPDR